MTSPERRHRDDPFRRIIAVGPPLRRSQRPVVIYDDDPRWTNLRWRRRRESPRPRHRRRPLGGLVVFPAEMRRPARCGRPWKAKP